MKLDLFSIPIWIGNIDASRIIVDDTDLSQTFRSEIKTSFSEQNNIPQDSLDYLYDVIIKLLNRSITRPYNIKLGHIWNNYYESDDYQEIHTHPGSDVSFIIYKKIKESSTIFQNPNSSVIGSYYYSSDTLTKLVGNLDYRPECRENQIVVFPTFLEHYVRKTSNALTVSGNMKITIDE